MKFWKTAEQEVQNFAVEKGFNMLKYFVVIAVAAIAWVGQPKFSNNVAKEIDTANREIAACEIAISGLRHEISLAQNSMDIETYAKTQGWDFVNLKNDQIVLTRNNKNKKYEIQSDKPNLLEQIFLTYRQ